jgi:hypothetical protein
MKLLAACPHCREVQRVEVEFRPFDYPAMDREAQRKAAAHFLYCESKFAEREMCA